MTNEAIAAAASQMKTTKDLLNLLNKIKMSELEDKGHPFLQPHLNFFIHPARNKRNYKTFQIPKKSGGFRVISAPTAMLKSFQTYTNRILQAFYVAPDYVTGFVPGKSVVDNAERHLGLNYVFNTDLKDFFPSISKSRVWATLKCSPFNFNDTIADAISGLCCTEMEVGGKPKWVLPQGSPCSPVLTNIVCKVLDGRLHKLAKKYNLRYSRYADDITFSGNRNVFKKDGTFRKELEGIISSQHFTINEKKTRLQTKNQRQEVTGLIVSDRVNVTRDYVRWLDNLLYIWKKYGEADAYARFLAHYAFKQNLRQEVPKMRVVVQGKLQYLKMVKGSDNEVWRRLQRRYNKLTGAKPSTESADLKYLYTISDFEKKTGATVMFEPDGNGIMQCSFSLNGKNTPVGLSKYARTRITNILAKNDSALAEKFKNSYLIKIYELENGDRYCKIERKRGLVKVSDIESIDIVTDFQKAVSETPDGNGHPVHEQAVGKNTDDILERLVSSEFDLKTLDEWDKIKSS